MPRLAAPSQDQRLRRGTSDGHLTDWQSNPRIGGAPYGIRLGAWGLPPWIPLQVPHPGTSLSVSVAAQGAAVAAAPPRETSGERHDGEKDEGSLHDMATLVAAPTPLGVDTAGTEPLTEKRVPKAALEDEAVRLMCDLFCKLNGMVEQMQDGDDGMDDDEMAELHEAENALLGRAAAWLQVKDVSGRWESGL